MSLTKASFSMIAGAYTNVKDFGATGDGITNDTVAIQSAMDSLTSGGVLYFPPGEYRIARNIGTNDRWGVKVTNSNITIKGDQAYLRRFNTDISTYALAYPLLFVGTPDSNVAAQTQNVVVDGVSFIGENVRHSVPGNAISDFRTGIVFKNTENTSVLNCSFTKVDSSAIAYQQIATFDYVNNVYYNTTKNYKSKINGCTFIAEPHAVAGRGQLHCVNADGIDGLVIDGNSFEWTDVCLSGESTYDTADQLETATFTYSSPASRTALGAVKRQTRDIVFSNNNCYNCSEHPAYPAMVSVVISGNTFTTDTPLICNTSPIQLRCRGVSVTGNTVIGYSSFIAITTPSSQVTVSGNSYYANDIEDKEGGAIQIQSQGLASYITNRSAYLTMIPMGDIVITGNAVVGPKTVVPTGQLYQNGLRVYTEPYDATNFPNGQIININISGNSFKYFQNYFYFIDDQYTNMIVNGNNFTAKPFIKAGFNGSTTMLTKVVILLNGATITEARNTTFTNNNVDGAGTLIRSRTGLLTANTLYPPEQFSNNKLDYIQITKTADVRSFDALTNFRGNVSVTYVDRTFSDQMLFNALYIAPTGEKKYNMEFTGGALRFYTDDAGTFISL
jgi:predicted ester cyclase